MNPYLEIVLASIIWGSTGTFVKLLHLQPTTFTFIRVSIPALILFMYLVLTRRKLWKKGSTVLLLTSVLSGPRILLYYMALSLTSVGNVVIIEYTYPVFITLLNSVYLKEKITLKQIIVLLLAFLGIIVMYGGSTLSISNRDFLGITLVLASTLIFVINSVLIKKEIHRYSRTEIVFYQNLIPAFMFLPFLFINRPFPTSTQWAIGGLFGILTGIVGFALYFSALRKIDLSTASILTYIEVISAIGFAVIFLKETVTLNMFVGGSLILISTILLHRFSAKFAPEINGI